MSLESSLSRVTQSVRPGCMFRSALLGGAAILLVSGGVLLGFVFGSAGAGGASGDRPRAEPAIAVAPRPACAVPGGVAFASLDPEDRSWMARRLVLCADVEEGRIDRAAYLERIDALDEPPRPVAFLGPAQPFAVSGLPITIWATRLLDRSTQYDTDSWSAQQALGPPDAEAGSDSSNAWASESADDRSEFLHVGFDLPVHAQGVEIVESYNPGAVTRVEVRFADGDRAVVYAGEAVETESSSLRRVFDFACTAKPVSDVYVTIDSAAVEGWNEIDAIGLRPCAVARP
jgi:hypothetical protein